MTFTAVTFAPVQSFIRSSRKLRDLYGSSLLLSHLARALHDDAIRQLNDQDAVISPAEVDATRGVPNTLLIQGDYARQQAESALLAAWGQSLEACRTWLETTLQGTSIDPGDWEQGWGASWKACKCHSWELFHGQGNTIAEAQQAIKSKVNKNERVYISNDELCTELQLQAFATAEQMNVTRTGDGVNLTIVTTTKYLIAEPAAVVVLQ